VWKSALKNQPTITLGCTMVTSLSLATLATATVLSTGSRTPKVDVNILGESISGKNESLDLRWTVKDVGELQVKVTGRNTTAVVQSLQRLLTYEANPLF